MGNLLQWMGKQFSCPEALRTSPLIGQLFHFHCSGCQKFIGLLYNSLLFGTSLSCFIFYHVVKVVLRFWLLGLLAWSGFDIVVFNMGFSKVVGGHLK